MAEVDDLRRGAGALRTALTPHPHRGDLIAAGAAPLTLGVLLVNVRLNGRWGTGVLLLLTLLATALVLGMGSLAPREGERPRSYQQVLLLAGLLLLSVTLLRLAQVLGVEEPLAAAGTRVWTFGAVTGVAVWLTRQRGSAVAALIAALTGIVTALALVSWAFHPHGVGTFRWVLLTLAIGLVLGALSQRDRRRRASVYLIDAAGIAVVLIGLTYIGALIQILTVLGAPGAPPVGGWKLVLLAAGLGLVAYAGVDREPGPAYAGGANLLLFVALAGIPGEDGPSLLFWPLALVLVGGLMVAAGLRPRRPLPPEPTRADGPGETVAGPGVVERTPALWAGARGDADEPAGS
jgi:hypothetical protein